jgi:hypothetical protein
MSSLIYAENMNLLQSASNSSGLKALAPSNWQAIPDLTVANLYWYFKVNNQHSLKEG